MSKKILSQFLQSCFPLVPWNYGFRNSIYSPKESFISRRSFAAQILLWWIRQDGRTSPCFVRIHTQRHCCHKRIYSKQIEWNGEKSLNHPNVVNFENVCYQSFAIIFEYVLLSFSPFRIFLEISGFDGFLSFLDYFSDKKVELFFPKITLDLIDGPQFLHNILVSYNNKHYANITDAVELGMAIKTTQYNVNSLTLGNYGHWFIKQDLF